MLDKIVELSKENGTSQRKYIEKPIGGNNLARSVREVLDGK